PVEFTACKVIADHLRSTAFLLADGVMPSNEGRGYVLRRIIRRAVRYGYQTLKAESALLHRLVPALLREMGDAYPELRRAEALITEMLKLEEESFRKSLGRGLKVLEEEREKTASASVFSGEAAFKLYDTYGFPLDLTQDILRASGMTVDLEEYNRCMDEQRARARAAWKGSGAQATEEVWFELQEEHGATEFLGYEMHNVEANVIALIKDGVRVDTATKGDTVDILLNQTPFYGESGGQEGDTGQFLAQDLEVFISDTAKQLGSLHVHRGEIKSGSLNVGQQLQASVNNERRQQLKANHSATHLLHAVLRQVLGDHVTQKGSLVAEDRLRFDISHPKAVTPEQLVEIEAKVNELIRQNTSVGTKLMTPDDAIEEGALALFGEKYGDEVRVVNMGEQVNASYSVELCGGTHVTRTGDIGLFKIISESAIAAGVRRIEALTGQEAIKYVTVLENNIQNLAFTLKSKPEELEERIEALQNDRKRLEKELSEARKSLAMGGSSEAAAEEINGITFIGRHFDGIPPKDLRSVAEDLKKGVSSGVIAV
ncbi:MAG: alanine--tRNA ligase, partial [Rickettsiales bacterium]|nr:alanine--tRNA ligase [Rickettsiales bacterium]